MERCPVCKTPVYEDEQLILTRHNGVQYFFDTQEHKDEFVETPGAYIGHERE